MRRYPYGSDRSGVHRPTRHTDNSGVRHRNRGHRFLGNRAIQIADNHETPLGTKRNLGRPSLHAHPTEGGPPAEHGAVDTDSAHAAVAEHARRPPEVAKPRRQQLQVVCSSTNTTRTPGSGTGAMPAATSSPEPTRRVQHQALTRPVAVHQQRISIMFLQFVNVHCLPSLVGR